MDVIDNKLFERVQEFVDSENLELKLSRDGRAELPWRMELLKVMPGDNKSIYVAHSMTFSGALRSTARYIQAVQAHSVDYDLPVAKNSIDQMLDDVANPKVIHHGTRTGRISSKGAPDGYATNEELIEIEHTDGHTQHPKSEF